MASKNISADFSFRLMLLMEKFGVTQSGIATRLDISQAAVSGWVNGAVPVRRTAKALAAIFGVNVEWLLYGKEPKLPRSQSEEIVSSLPIKGKFDPPLSARSVKANAPLDAKQLKRLARKLVEAAKALVQSSEIIAGGGGGREKRSLTRKSRRAGKTK